MSKKQRVCLIGAGPSGLSVLFQAVKLNKDNIEIVCYEKQDVFGGLWNYTWRTGTDEHGQLVHGSMYRYLWSNGPKEASLEFPDYTFEKHFGKSIPSFPPREVLFDYIKGRFNQFDLNKFIRYKHVVTDVTFDKATGSFSVVAKDLLRDKTLAAETFDYLINASGHFSVPHAPTFEGFDKFPGRILHAHDFRDAVEFNGQRLLVIGGSYSAEDISLQTVKYGAKSVIISHRTRPMGFKWPKEIEERPLLVKLDGKMAHFKDGSKAEVDAILLATGYLHHYPHLADDLRLSGPNVMYNTDSYRNTVWTAGGNGKMLYMGAMDQYYTFTMFDSQACWAIKYVAGDIRLPAKELVEKDNREWQKRLKNLKDCHEDIDFQADWVNLMAKESNYGHDLDIRHMFHEWEHHKDENILTYRDKRFTSKFTGKLSPQHHSSFMEAMDDSIECFLGSKA